MKNLYLNILALSVCTLGLNAQVTLTKASHDPVIGDLDKRANYDSTTVVPKNTGANQVWNFQSMQASMSWPTYTTSYVNPASAPNNSLFPTATIASNEGGSNYEFFRSTTSTVEMLGRYDSSSPETMVFSNPGILRTYPLSYGGSNSDSWTALQTSPSETLNMSGSVTVAATGTGTVILPNGNVHPNCLQVIETITLTVVSGTMTITGYFYNVFYYEAGSKFPVFEYAYEVLGGPKKFFASANSDALMAGINENGISSEPVSVYPNPVKDELFISLNGRETPLTLEVLDLQGRNVISQEFTNSVNVGSLEQGLYIIKLSYKDKVIYNRFVKTN